MNKTTRTSRATSITSNSSFNVDIPQWSEASTSEDEDTVIRNCRRKSNVDIINEEVKRSSSEVEEIKIRKCRRKSHVNILKDKTREISSEEEKIVIRKCRRRSRV